MKIYSKWKCSTFGLAAGPYFANASPFPNTRKFRLSLNPFAIGVQINQVEMIDKAKEFNFEALASTSKTMWRTFNLV